MQRFLTPRFLARKTFNQRGLQFRFPSYLVGDLVASLGCATKSAVVDYECCQQPASVCFFFHFCPVKEKRVGAAARLQYSRFYWLQQR